MTTEKVKQMLRDAIHKRSDEKPFLFYFSHKDFKGLCQHSYNVKSSKGHQLVGYFYYYESEYLKTPLRTDTLVIFDHGMWSGHRSYFREIEMLCKNGYIVYSYDHTGCFESEGEETFGFAQSYLDLCDVLSSLKEHEKIKDMKLYVIGHSWGGFATMNCPNPHNVDKVVAISGFISVEEIVNQYIPFFLKKHRRAVFNMETKDKGSLVDGRRSLFLRKTKALYIHSRDDKIVSYKKHFLQLKKELASALPEQVQFLSLNKKNHNPTYTINALKAKSKMERELKSAHKKGLLNTAEDCEKFKNTYDWYQITEQDQEVWDKILEFLDSPPLKNSPDPASLVQDFIKSQSN